MNVILRILGLLLVLALLGGVYWYVRVHNGNADGRIRVSGNIEVTDVQVSFKIPGRVVKRFVDEGEMIEQGAPVADLDTTDLQAEAAARRAELQNAQAYLAELRAGSRPQEIAASKAAMEQAQHTLSDLEAGSRPQEIAAAEAAALATASDEQKAQSDLGRATRLVQSRAIAAEDFDRIRTTYQVAVEKHREAVARLNLLQEGFRKEKIAEARAALAQAKAQYDLVLAGPRKEQIEQAEARVAQAKANLKLAETRLDYAHITSPLRGVVLSKNIEPGEYVSPGTAVITVGDLVHVWLRAYIEESDLGRVKPGQKAIVSTDNGKTYEGRVGFISSEAEFTPKNVQTQQERVNLVYRIKIDITNPNNELKPGMPADAVIETEP